MSFLRMLQAWPHLFFRNEHTNSSNDVGCHVTVSMAKRCASFTWQQWMVLMKRSQCSWKSEREHNALVFWSVWRCCSHLVTSPSVLVISSFTSIGQPWYRERCWKSSPASMEEMWKNGNWQELYGFMVVPLRFIRIHELHIFWQSTVLLLIFICCICLESQWHGKYRKLFFRVSNKICLFVWKFSLHTKKTKAGIA